MTAILAQEEFKEHLKHEPGQIHATKYWHKRIEEAHPSDTRNA